MSYKMEEAKKMGCLQDQPYSLEHMDRNEPLDSGYFSPNHQCCSCRNLKNPQIIGQGCTSLHHTTITFCFDQPPTPKPCPSHASQNKERPENKHRPNLFRQNLAEYIPKKPANHDKNRVALQVMPILKREQDIPNTLNLNNSGATPVGLLPMTPLITRVRALWLRSYYAYPPSGLLLKGTMLHHKPNPKKDLNPSHFLPQDYQVADNGTPDTQSSSVVSHLKHSCYSQQPADDNCLNMGVANVNEIPTSASTIELSRPDKSALYVRRHATKSPIQEVSALQLLTQTLASPLPCKREKRYTTDSKARQSSRRERPSSLHVYHDAEVVRQLGARASINIRNTNGFLTRAPTEGCLKVGLQLRKLGDDFETFVRSETVPALRSVDYRNAGFCALVRKAILIALRVLLNLDDVYTR